MSEEQVTLQDLLVEQANAFLTAVNGKTLEELGGQEGFNQLVVSEILNVYNFLQIFVVLFENFTTVQNANWENVDASFTNMGDAISILGEQMNVQNEAFNKALSNTVNRLSSQMTNQNKVLDKQVIKLSKSISKITGGNS